MSKLPAMTRTHLLPIAAVLFTLILGIGSLAGLSAGIRSPVDVANAIIDEKDRLLLHGNVHPRATPQYDVGPTDPSLPMKRMILLLKIAPEKQAELDRLLAELQDSSSPNFHRWLTPEEFGKRFGRSQEEIDMVCGWLVSQGFTVDETAKGGSWINFSGTVANVERAFHANMHDYNVDGHLYHANSKDPSIPRALTQVVAGPVRLHNFLYKAAHTRPRPMPAGKSQPGYTDPADGGYSLAPGDFAVIYDVNSVYGQGYDGTGVTIAVVERTDSNAGNWATFRSTFGLPANPPDVIVNGPDPGDLGANEDTEADLDVEWSGAVAPGATIDFVVSQTTNGTDGVDLSAQYIVDNNMAPIVSDCFGECEQAMGSTSLAFYNNLWQQAASQGITVFVASGDTGAYGCEGFGVKAVNGLASTACNIAVGGTQFNNGSDPGIYWNDSNASNGTSALSYIPEVAWNDWTQGYELASGGGVSEIYSKPAWQVSPGVPNDGLRDLPDVSLNAADLSGGYRVYTSNSWSIIGGTSAASPSLAGIMALIVQSAGGERQGNFNAVLYQFGNTQYGGTSGAYEVFHDITSGTNGFGADFPGYSCGTGYDLVTGLGSIDAFNLLLAFQQTLSTSATHFSVSAPSSAISGTAFNFTITAMDAKNFMATGYSGTVHFTSTDALATLPQDTTLTNGTGTFTATLNTAGNQTITATDTVNASITGTSTITVSLKGNGVCGSANGQNLLTAPASNLCSAGVPTAVTGSGPWTWSCTGSNGGSTANCSANLEVNGVCGSASGQGFLTAPASNLCSAGLPTAVTGSGPWTWSCTGSNGGTTASCSANLEVNGACGSSNGGTFFSAPTTNLCNAGAPTTVTGSGPWSWTCQGLNDGTNANCSGNPNPQPANGVCGVANGHGFSMSPTTNLCSAGAASTVTGTGPWNWSCQGINGGSTMSCSANLDGECGSASGEGFFTAPLSNLCISGKASAITGRGPWNWTCAGSKNGTTAHCTAFLEVNGACGSANGNSFLTEPSSGLCSAGRASVLTGSGRWDWTCIGLNGGSTVNCSARLEVNGACGAANKGNLFTAPVLDLCSEGNPSEVTGQGPWHWTCAGLNGGSKASCSANLERNGICGSASGASFSKAPAKNLCTSGKASKVTGTGPWNWTCAGANGGTTAECSANLR